MRGTHALELTRKCIPDGVEHVSHIFVAIAHFMHCMHHVLSDISP